ncbi:DUF726-domain-containing protein [Guyanagaster necrorhizus]|uniref:DUF726-domain-containing protein n=1 Tax=Guyanagaster necrorhizus TaxID=856835 RepID=A0A9P8ATZ3_9AGAR|nr:DUF726-domain-containing protein [Guyanagaster necrorhizus MCA 3950]KAG7447934.1 DUF726-domain-containing protein [Guyanagaster necrorhizus MCA 3950]
MSGNLAQLTPPKQLTQQERQTVFQHIFRRLAAYRNTAELYALTEYSLSSLPESTKSDRRNSFNKGLNAWAQQLLEHAWVVCGEPEGERCPELDPYADTSTGQLPKLLSEQGLKRVLNSILFLHITTSKEYSARTRSFLNKFGSLDEDIIVSTLRHPDRAVEEAQRHTMTTTQDHAQKNKVLRMVGMGLGAVVGGVLVGVTGGLAAPLVGAGVTTVLGWLGIGGTVAGLLASGLAGSSVVCGALFGVYGAKSTADMVQRHTREIRDLAVLPIGVQSEETLGVRLCVSGWISSPIDFSVPWTVFGGDNTFALQWEVQALQELSDALLTLVKSHTMKYIKVEIVKRTVFASLMSSLAPIAWLKIGQIIDNPWMNSKALAIKAGAVLGDLLAKRAFGNRPATLVGYSLGSLVIFEALKFLAALPPLDTGHLIEDVFLYGTPVSTDQATWASVRRLVSGRLVNGYSTNDYVLAVLSRVSSVTWNVAGLHSVDVVGVENVHCDFVDGHTMWRGMIGKSLQLVDAPGLVDSEIYLQMENIGRRTEELDLGSSQEDWLQKDAN